MGEGQESDQHQHHVHLEGEGRSEAELRTLNSTHNQQRDQNCLVPLPLSTQTAWCLKDRLAGTFHSALWSGLGKGSYAHFTGEETEASRAAGDLRKVTWEVGGGPS